LLYDRIVFQKILDSLKSVTAQRTSVVIAHRLSTVVDADEILVLDKGTVVERGRHSQLLSNTNSLYSQLWQKQHEFAFSPMVLDLPKS
jgi:ABC-type transport system involved in Fe-S cluster assembly fused permease/ATPase subunit